MLQEQLLPSDLQLAKTQLLRAGELTCVYESGNLRYIRCGQTELIRMIYGAVRDQHWGTLPHTIEEEEISIQERTFTIRYRAVYRQDDVVYAARFFMEGTADSRIVFSMNGTALEPFRSNRIGLCVLHPVAECAGQPVIITHPDATQTRSFFPQDIAPFQPFLEVQQMNWTTTTGARAHLFLQGDIFETEDQRNWSDHSFKTYSTPQRIPFPVSIARGSTIDQSLIFTLSGPPVKAGPADSVISEFTVPFPEIGYSRSRHQGPLSEPSLEHFKQIPFDHYRVLLHLHSNSWQRELGEALREASQLSAVLELVLFFSDDASAEWQAFMPALNNAQEQVYSILVLHKDHAVSPPALFTMLYHDIKKAMPQVLVGYGTHSFFTELNRQPPPAIPIDFTSFSLHPQVHATDTRTLLENLESLPGMLETIAKFAPGLPVAVAVTLQDNSDAAGADPRQYTYFAAAWTLMCLQQLGKARISFFETTGSAGLLYVSSNGKTVCSPVFDVLRTLHSFAPVWIIKRQQHGRVLMDGLLLENAAGGRLFIRMPEAILHFTNGLS